ncbi:hypothetical protein [Corynebacterium renale]|nr:hypothetical protein [Corynebacterium renale]
MSSQEKKRPWWKKWSTWHRIRMVAVGAIMLITCIGLIKSGEAML